MGPHQRPATASMAFGVMCQKKNHADGVMLRRFSAPRSTRVRIRTTFIVQGGVRPPAFGGCRSIAQRSNNAATKSCVVKHAREYRDHALRHSRR
jgi:hypothetical protein